MLRISSIPAEHPPTVYSVFGTAIHSIIAIYLASRPMHNSNYLRSDRVDRHCHGAVRVVVGVPFVNGLTGRFDPPTPIFPVGRHRTHGRRPVADET